MKAKLLTLLTALLFLSSGAWGTDIDVIEHVTHAYKTFPVNGGLFTVTNTANMAISSNQLQVKSATGKFQISTTVSGYVIKSIVFTDKNSSKNGGFTCEDGDYMTGPTSSTYTYTAPAATTAANFQLIGNGGTAAMEITSLVLTTSDDIHELYGFTNSPSWSFTSNPTSDIEVTTTNGSGFSLSSSTINWSNNSGTSTTTTKDITITASDNIKYVAFVIKDDKKPADDKMVVSGATGTYSNGVWTASAATKSVAFRQNTGGGIYVEKIYVATEEAVKRTVTTSVNNEAYGSVTATAAYDEGDDVVITATPNAAYKFVEFVIDEGEAGETTSTENPYTFSSIGADHTIKAVFEARKTLTYSVTTEQNGTRTDNTVVYAGDDDHVTAYAANTYFTSDNQTLTGWKNGETPVALGADLDLSGGNVTLTPVFADNAGATFAATLTSSKSNFNVTWDFSGSNSHINSVQNKTGFLMAQATINGASVDMPLAFDTDPGKLDNFTAEHNPRTDAWSQINDGTTLTIPVVDGSVVTLTSFNEGTTTTVNSEAFTTTGSAGNYTSTYTYSGSTGTIDIVAGGLSYISTINVTYPSQYPAAPTITPADGSKFKTATQEITMTADDGAAIRYTLDGTEPTESSTLYDGAAKPSISATTTVKAIAIKGGLVSDVAEATITKIDLIAEATVVTGSETWDWSVLSEWDNRELPNDESIPNRNTDLILKNMEYYDNVTFPAEFGDASALVVKVQNPWRTANGGTFAMGTSIKFTTSVPGTVAVTFTNTGNSNRCLVVNGNAYTETVTTSNTNVKTVTVNVPAGEVVLTGMVIETEAANMLRFRKIEFTADNEMDQESIEIVCSGGLASYSNTTKGLDFSTSNVKAYIVTAANSSSATLTEVTKAPANTGLIIFGTEGETYNVLTTTSATAEDVNGNLLEATAAGGTAVAADEAYILSKTDGKFHLCNAGTIPAGKAYLPAGSLGARVLDLTFGDDQTTGVTSIAQRQTTGTPQVYNLAGQRVAQPTKGLYIVNGKKIIIK